MVQGVGFRFTTEKLARRFTVTGFIKNLADGKVEVVAEGDGKILQDFLQAIGEAFRPHIQHADIEWGEPTNEYQGFGIKF